MSKDYTENEKALLGTLFKNRLEARNNRLAWQKHEKALTDKIHEVLGTDEDNPKPISVPGVISLNVVPSYGLDVKAIKENEPEIYAKYETVSWKRYLNPPEKA